MASIPCNLGSHTTSCKARSQYCGAATVLEAPRVAGNGGGGGTGGGQHLSVVGADATAAAQAELLATANELYQRMDAGRVGLRPDGAYWAALPVHIATLYGPCHDSPPCLMFNTCSASPVSSPLLVSLISDSFAAR